MGYEKDLEINEYDLINEWLKQPNLYFFYANKLASAEEKEREKKERIRVCRAQTEFKIRESPKKFNIDKITNQVVDFHVERDEDVCECISEWNKARKDIGVLKAAVVAVEQRKKALENLSQFWLNGMMSKPKLEGMEKKAYSKKAKEKLKRLSK